VKIINLLVPHTDQTPTEHSFVSIYPINGSADLVWLDEHPIDLNRVGGAWEIPILADCGHTMMQWA
jgi:hypothetical protein